MDKENANPIIHGAVGSKRDASLFDAVPSTDVAAVPSTDVAAASAGASEAAAAGRGQIPPGWDPYEPVPYVPPPNRYDTSIEDPWNEVTTVCFLFCSPFLFEPYLCWCRWICGWMSIGLIFAPILFHFALIPP
jgi:hypothetical protein